MPAISDVHLLCFCYLLRIDDSATPPCVSMQVGKIVQKSCSTLLVWVSPRDGYGCMHLAWLHTRTCDALVKAGAEEEITCCGVARALQAEPLQALRLRYLRSYAHNLPALLCAKQRFPRFLRACGFCAPINPPCTSLRPAPTPKRSAKKPGGSACGVCRNVSGRSWFAWTSLKRGQLRTKPQRQMCASCLSYKALDGTSF